MCFPFPDYDLLIAPEGRADQTSNSSMPRLYIISPDDDDDDIISTDDDLGGNGRY